VNPPKFLTELKRRNVYRAAVAYGVVAWFLTQLTTQIFPFFEIPNSAVRFVVIALAVGFPIAMLLSWLYELTPEGIVRTEDLDPAQARSVQRATGRILDFIIIGVLLLVIAMLIVGRWILNLGIRSLLKFMSAQSVERFIGLLKQSPSGAVFNPWWEVDKQNDIGPNAPGIRREHLRAYLCERLGKPRLAVVGEALGYRGGHFSGIPMTSERVLLGKKEARIMPAQIFTSITPRRTSKPAKCPTGFSEPTTTIVWSTLLKLGLSPEQFVLWNAFPWHSFDSRRGMLSNRTPTKSERSAGLPLLKAFLDLFPCDEIIALGNVAASQLKELNADMHRVRHPASGGAKLFRQQIGRIAKSDLACFKSARC
jgi:uracil-DNA glycosylase